MFCSECGIKLEDNSLFCHECGTKVINQNSVNPSNLIINAEKTIKCPFCLFKNTKEAILCKECGKNFTKTLGFFKRDLMMDMDMDITPTEVIIHPRSVFTGRRKNKKHKKIYKRNKMHNVKVGDVIGQFTFSYDGKEKGYRINPEYTDEIRFLLGIPTQKQLEEQHHEEKVKKGLIKVIKALDGQLEVYEHKIVLKKDKPFYAKKVHPFRDFVTHKEILIKYLSSIQLKETDSIGSGYIKFVSLGEDIPMNVNSISKYEKSYLNTLTFTNKQERDFLEIKEMIESKILEQKD